MRIFREHLASKTQDKQFAKDFEKERSRLRIAYDIHAARIESGLSQKQLARKVGTTQQMVSRVESAAVPNTSLGTIRKIATALNKDIGLVPRR